MTPRILAPSLVGGGCQILVPTTLFSWKEPPDALQSRSGGKREEEILCRDSNPGPQPVAIRFHDSGP
jgi:hypothetical protein